MVTYVERLQKTPKHRPVTVGLCCLLAILFLYNPFLTTAAASDFSHITHRASYRATLAASELQHFSPTDDRDFCVPLAVLATRIETPEELHSNATVERAPVVHSGQFLRADLWFRPPPRQ